MEWKVEERSIGNEREKAELETSSRELDGGADGGADGGEAFLATLVGSSTIMSTIQELVKLFFTA